MSQTAGRGKQIKPTRAEVRAAYERLRAAAAAGDVRANALLIELAAGKGAGPRGRDDDS